MKRPDIPSPRGQGPGQGVEARHGGSQAHASVAVSGVRFTPSFPSERAAGLLGWVSFVIGGSLRADGITLRRTREGRLTLVFPERRDSRGRPHPLLLPVDRRARAALEQVILEAVAKEVGA